MALRLRQGLLHGIAPVAGLGAGRGLARLLQRGGHGIDMRFGVLRFLGVLFGLGLGRFRFFLFLGRFLFGLFLGLGLVFLLFRYWLRLFLGFRLGLRFRLGLGLGLFHSRGILLGLRRNRFRLFDFSALGRGHFGLGRGRRWGQRAITGLPHMPENGRRRAVAAGCALNQADHDRRRVQLDGWAAGPEPYQQKDGCMQAE